MKFLVLIVLSTVSFGIFGQEMAAQALTNTLGVEIKWTGFVQGVGFRAYVKKQATESKKIFGWIANQNDG
ncbi:MAG: acylphosphatase, partial [Gammaproteobacteria bacterium]|nr:acylphosphatase [Gammaproteobacteria bacterium]